MKNILVFKTSKMDIFLKLLNKVINKYGNSCKIWCIAQHSVMDGLASEYPSVSFIGVDDGFLNYKQFKADKNIKMLLKNVHFAKAFIPSSSIDFTNFEEVFLIAGYLKIKRVVLFNKNSKVYYKNINLLEIKAVSIIKSDLFTNLVVSAHNMFLIIKMGLHSINSYSYNVTRLYFGK